MEKGLGGVDGSPLEKRIVVSRGVKMLRSIYLRAA